MPGRTLATAFVEIRPEGKRFGAELRTETAKAADDAGTAAGHHFGEAMKKAIKGAGLALAVGAAFVGVKAIGFLKQANKDASDLNETVSKAQNIYPASQEALERFAATSAAALGLSRQQALEGVASFGNFFNQIGIGEKESLKMSTALIQLSADLGSFNNADPSQVMDAFLSATRGEYDALQRFIPTINAATVQAEAMRLTHKKSTKDLTEADKALALYQLSLKGAGKGAGDFARTAEGQANALRTWKANLSDIRGEVGTALMPVITEFVNLLNSEAVPAFKELWAKHGPAVTKALQQFGFGIQALIMAWRGEGVTSDGFVGRMERIGDALHNLGPTFRNIVAEVKAWFAAQKEQGGPSLGQQFSSINDSARQLLPLVKDFIAQMPSLNDVVNVGATVLGFLADHTDELRAALPLLVGAVVAYKIAQLASNVAVAASPVFKILDWRATRLQTAAIRENTVAQAANRAATAASAAAQVAETGAQNVGLLTRIRSTAAMVAQRIAMVAVRAATIAWTAVQAVLNVVLTLNPIGLIVIAIAALVAGIIYAYKHSETFRAIVDAAFKGIKVAISAVVDWVVGTAWPWVVRFFDLWINAPRKAGEFIGGFARHVVDTITGIRDRVFGAARGMWDGIVEAAKGAINKVISIFNRLDFAIHIGPIPDWVPGIGGKRFDIPDLFPDLPLLARGALVRARPGGTAAVLAEAGEDEFAVPRSEMRRMIAEAVAAGAGGDLNLNVIADNKALQAFFELLEFIVERVQRRTAAAVAGGVRL